jgi:uncharacterized protein YdhG (YjbR/CyaY superfamily)
MNRPKDAARASAGAVDAYLDRVPNEPRAALESLRSTIRAAAPEATEGIGYQIPTFYHRGPLVAFGAAKKHCSFYVMSPAVMEAYREQLEAYETSKGTIRFRPQKPLPAALVRQLVKARIVENEARARD